MTHGTQLELSRIVAGMDTIAKELQKLAKAQQDTHDKVDAMSVKLVCCSLRAD